MSREEVEKIVKRDREGCKEMGRIENQNKKLGSEKRKKRR